MVWWRPASPGYAALAIATYQDGLFRAGLSGFSDGVFVFWRNVFRDRRRMTLDVIEDKGIRRDHRAERMPLAAV
jgi:hypothetical protein